jgi:cytochrome c6
MLFFMTSVLAGGTDEDYEEGAELYDLACANCHGKNMVNVGAASFNLKEFPPDRKDRFIESVSKGKGFMPAFGEIFDAIEIGQLWIYVSRNHN